MQLITKCLNNDFFSKSPFPYNTAMIIYCIAQNLKSVNTRKTILTKKTKQKKDEISKTNN